MRCRGSLHAACVVNDASIFHHPAPLPLLCRRLRKRSASEAAGSGPGLSATELELRDATAPALRQIRAQLAPPGAEGGAEKPLCAEGDVEQPLGAEGGAEQPRGAEGAPGSESAAPPASPPDAAELLDRSGALSPSPGAAPPLLRLALGKSGVEAPELAPSLLSPHLLPEHAKILGSLSAVVALHPDQATEPAVDLALARGLPWAVVPCCVFPALFPRRRVPGADGAPVPVRTYGDFVRYLALKSPGARLAKLPFEGMNVVVYDTGAGPPSDIV